MKPLLIALLLAGSCFAQDSTPAPTQQLLSLWDSGNSFVRECDHAPDRSLQSAECVAYVMGVWDGFVFGKIGRDYCISDSATPLQLKRITVKYISDHPEKAHMASAWLVILAISDAFSCK